MGNRMPNTGDMANNEIFTMRISAKLKGKLNKLAKSKNKSSSEIIREFIESTSRY